MKLTRQQLQKIIQEELQMMAEEGDLEEASLKGILGGFGKLGGEVTGAAKELGRGAVAAAGQAGRQVKQTFQLGSVDAEIKQVNTEIEKLNAALQQKQQQLQALQNKREQVISTKVNKPDANVTKFSGNAE